jgi:hypothetical protein
MYSHVAHDGERNAIVQICGPVDLSKAREWRTVVAGNSLKGDFSILKIDHILYALSDGIEVHVAWVNGEEVSPMLPLAGRGRMDFTECRGLTNSSKEHGRQGDIAIKVFAIKDKPISPLIMVVLELLKQTGAQ